MNIRAEIITEDSAWESHYADIDVDFNRHVAASTLRRFSNMDELAEIELCILHSNDDNIINLNRQFRQQAKATNVLSFPNFEFKWQEFAGYKHKDSVIYLGDIAFSLQSLQKEADEQNKPIKDHYAHLLVHAILHLIGYDHVNDDDAEAMEQLEINILQDLAIKSPYSQIR